jgi:tRNA-Thr(GGU) m(6)t(6)A37 methyltransferase TsaA
MKQERILELKPIGVIHSPYKDRGKVPYQGYRSKRISRIEIFSEFEEGLQDIDGFSHVVVIYWFHKSQGYHLMVKTPWDDVPRGLFTTRSPRRPCPLALTVVELVSRDRNILKVRGLDAIDGSPLLDIKPYVAVVDERSIVRSGWLEGKLGKGRR